MTVARSQPYRRGRREQSVDVLPGVGARGWRVEDPAVGDDPQESAQHRVGQAERLVVVAECFQSFA
jgi:hypothetical protein